MSKATPALTREQLQLLFPRAGKNQALTGNIPMKFFQYFEDDITQIMQQEGLTKYYRGGRYSNVVTPGKVPFITVRADAKAVKLYRRPSKVKAKA